MPGSLHSSMHAVAGAGRKPCLDVPTSSVSASRLRTPFPPDLGVGPGALGPGTPRLETRAPA